MPILRFTQILFTGILLIIFCLPSCQKKNTDQGPDRPYQPFAFRSVLDSQSRMLTLALHDNLWVAYHTDSCALYKAWKGYVHLQGAVYDNGHGPQPISIGDAWIENANKHPWKVTRNGTNILTEVRYKGHSIDKGRAAIHYELVCNDGSAVLIEERPEYVEKQDQTGFERVFTVSGIGDNMEVSVAQSVASIAMPQHVETNGTWKTDREQKNDIDGRQVMDMDGYLTMHPKEPTKFTLWFIPKPTIANRNKKEGDDVSLPLGQRLIGKNDCKTCHNEKVQTIGPSYKAIAVKYPWNESSVTQLANKVIAGGGGIWGAQIMSPHPELAITDAQEMVRYILQLDTTDVNQDGGEQGQGTLLEAITAEPKNVLPGLMMEVWTNQKGHSKLPVIPANKRSDQAGIVTDFFGLDAGKFGGLDEDFVFHAKGYVFAEKDITASWRIVSDDGSRLTIGGNMLIDNDGMHGTEAKEARITLKKGYHPVWIEFIQGKGGRYFSFEWKPDDESAWSGVPSEMLLHDAGEHAKLAGKNLSMRLGKLIPGDKAPLTSVHPSYDLSQARPFDFLPKVGGMDFMSDGSMIICTWDPAGAVYKLTGVETGDPAKIKVTQIAAGLAEPLGLSVIRDTIYVLQKQELTRLIDTDKDGIINAYQCVNNMWPTSANFHEFAFGLAQKDGDVFATLAIAIQPGGASGLNQISSRGKVVRFDLPSGNLEYLASGLRTPNGIGIGIDGEIFVADNQGDWLPSSKILHVSKDAFYGQRSVDYTGTEGKTAKQPMLWLPQDEIGNSPSTPLLLNDGPYKGQMIHCEVTHGGVKRDFIEKINGEYQGCVFRFIQGLEAGINRMAWGPDGALYVGGIGNSGNWGQTDKLWYGLQRLKYNSKPTFEMLAVRAKTDGVEIEFTEPLREGDGWDLNDYEIRQWRYVPTAEYGGPKVDHVALRVLSASVSEDRKKVGLRLEGMKAGHIVYVHLNDAYISATGLPLWTTEAWYTMNQIPANNPVFAIPSPTFALNTLTSSEQKDGWKLLFDGKTLNGWHSYGRDVTGSEWKVVDGAIMLDIRKNAAGERQADGGDIITTDEFENFELELEWKISPCGNSGIFHHVVESAAHDAPWRTGPEMQVLDNACHPDSRYTTHRAGDLYDLLSCTYESVKPAGQWNKVRIISQKGQVEYWLNGIRVVSFQMYTDAWKSMIANSKFKDFEGWGMATKGKISLQDHGDPVWYRNIKIKPLGPTI